MVLNIKFADRELYAGLADERVARTECHRCGEIIEKETNFFGDCEFDADEDGHLCDTCHEDWLAYKKGKADEATREFYDGEF